MKHITAFVFGHEEVGQLNNGDGSAGLLFRSVVVKWCRHDEIDAALNLLVCYPDGVLREVFYENVFYSQLNEAARGMTIFRVQRISLSEFVSQRHQRSAAQFAQEYHDPDFEKLRERMGQGFKLFMHYMECDAQYVVLADRMAISD